MQIDVNGHRYPVDIVKKRSNKNTYIRVKEDLTLYITTNLFTTEKQIEKLIRESKKAIDGMYERQLLKIENNTGFLFLGTRYDLVYTSNNSVEFGQSKVFVGKSVDLDKWYKQQAKVLFQEHLDRCYQNFSRNIPKPTLRIRKMTTRWGVCNYKDVVITLNLELMKRDINCLDYVIYHEL